MKPSCQLPAPPETRQLDAAALEIIPLALPFALGVVFWAPFAACGISEMLEMVDLDSTLTRVIPHLEKPHGCFSSELPGLAMEVMVRELLFGMAEGDGLLLLPSSSGCVPRPPACPCPSCPTSMVPVSCAGTPGDFPALSSLLVSRRSSSLGWMCLESEGKCSRCP